MRISLIVLLQFFILNIIDAQEIPPYSIMLETIDDSGEHFVSESSYNGDDIFFSAVGHNEHKLAASKFWLIEDIAADDFRTSYWTSKGEITAAEIYGRLIENLPTSRQSHFNPYYYLTYYHAKYDVLNEKNPNLEIREELGPGVYNQVKISYRNHRLYTVENIYTNSNATFDNGDIYECITFRITYNDFGVGEFGFFPSRVIHESFEIPETSASPSEREKLINKADTKIISAVSLSNSEFTEKVDGITGNMKEVTISKHNENYIEPL